MSDLNAIRRVLATTVPRWLPLIETLPPDLLERPPSAGEWSAAECLEHLLHAERAVFGVRLRHLLEGRPELVIPNTGHWHWEFAAREIGAQAAVVS